MALTTKSYAEQLGRALAEAAKDEPLVEEVWVSTHPGGVHLWLITKDIDFDQQRELYTLSDAVYERFNRPDFEIFRLNPRFTRGDIHDSLPRRAVQIPIPTRAD